MVFYYSGSVKINELCPASELIHELQKAKHIEDFISANSNEFTDYTLPEYLEKLLDAKKRTKADIIKASGLNQVYGYHIFSGDKNPSRNKVLAIALAFQLTLEETQYLLKYAQAKELYVRNKWDSIIIFALNKQLTVMQTNQLLHELSEPMLE